MLDILSVISNDDLQKKVLFDKRLKNQDLMIKLID